LSELENRVIVVGGGIGGLSSAVALNQAGVEVKVLERAPELLAFGGAIQVWTNAMIGFEALGVASGLRAHGLSMDRQVFRSWRGKELMRVPIGELARRHSVPPPLLVARSDILRTLASALPDETIEFGAEMVGLQQDDGGVTAHLANGRSERGGVLVAADGIDSRLRASLFPEAQPRYAGYQYWRCLMAFDGVPEGELLFTFGRGDRFGFHAVGSGRVYWFAVVVAEPGSGDAIGSKRDVLRERFGRFPPPTMELIEAADEEAISITDIRDLPPMDSWTKGRVTLLGDAAHATTPNLGRGAGEAIGDATALATHLAALGGFGSQRAVEGALGAFEEERRAATRSVQERSRKIGRLASWRNPAAVRLRELLLSTVAGKGQIKGTEREFAAWSARAS